MRRCMCLKRQELVLDRSQAYIGVLIDDLVTKENHEAISHDDITRRISFAASSGIMQIFVLTAIGHEIGLKSDERYQKLNDKKRQIDEEIKRLKTANYRHNTAGTGIFLNSITAHF